MHKGLLQTGGEPLGVEDASAGYQVSTANSPFVKPGYKQTEVGIIPEEWNLKALPDVLWFYSGKAHEQFIVEEGQYIVVNSKFVSTNGEVRKYSSKNFLPARKDDILMVMSDLPNGRALAKCFLVGEDGLYAVNQRVCVLRAKKDDPEYLFYFLNRNPYFLRFDDGVQQTHLLNPVILSCPVVVPPNIEEQRAIATALSDVDALIAAQSKLIAKKRAIKTAAMQQLLTGKQRLPGFSGEWELKRLGDLLSVRHGKNQHQIVVNDGKYPILATSGEIGRTNTFLYDKPSVLIGRKGTIDKPRYQESPFWTIDTLFYTEIANETSPKYIYFKFLTIDWSSYNEASGVPSLNASTIEAIEFQCPRFEEQTAIANILSDMDAEIAALGARRDKTQAIKQGMMQELLTGRIRLQQESRDRVHEQVQPYKQEQYEKAGHSWAFNEAVVISTLAAKFGSGEYPLGRVRYTKLAYLMHRHVENQPEGYLKKAAGPYNPEIRYKGPEAIAQKNGYIEAARSGKFSGFIASRNIDQALSYFEKWYGKEVLKWLEQFRYEKKESLELLTTVDMAIQELRANDRMTTVEAVKDVLRGHPEWQPKLKREIFADANIEQAMARSRALFDAVHPMAGHKQE